MIKLVQCWDDGVLDDIRLCDLFREKNAKASFNLNMGLHGEQRGQPWRYKDCKDVQRLSRAELTTVYADFTIANHSLTHAWPSRIALDDWKYEVTENRKQLQDLFQQPIHGFAYPFGDSTPESQAVIQDNGHLYARTCANATPCFPPEDPMLMPTDCHFAAPDFWERFENAKAANASVFYFWGHSFEMLDETYWQAFSDKLDRLNANPETEWAELPELFTAEM